MARYYASVLHEYAEDMGELSDSEFGRLIRGLLQYSSTGVEPKFNGNEKHYWRRVKRVEDEHKASYQNTCATNRENGKKGGRPKKTEKTEENQSVPTASEKRQLEFKSKSNTQSPNGDMSIEEKSCQGTDPNINSGADAPSSAVPKGVYTEIIDFLNEQAGTRYKASSQKTRTLIRARLKEGFTVNDFKTVIQKKCQLWKGTEFEQYLRPETLFGTKFESYLNERQNAAVRQGDSRSKPRNALQVAHPPTPEEEAEQARRIEENQRWMREFLQTPGSDKQ